MESTQNYRDALYSFVCFKAMYILIIYQQKLLNTVILHEEVTTNYNIQFSIIISRNVKLEFYLPIYIKVIILNNILF
jgi:hypothetical protein